MRKQSMFMIVVLLCLLLANPTRVSATPHWTENDMRTHQAMKAGQPVAPRIAITPAWLDEYNILSEYEQICDFLVTMQDTTATINFGGLHEGETTRWNIIETDNTQEAIRVWCTYAELTGDPDRYRDNVLAAWTYTMNFPAYDEGGPTSVYYSVHNCGWALVAESKYRQIYGNDSFLWYADSCAWFIMNHRLPYSGTWAQLHPLVEGWGAGTLYEYGIEQGDQEAVDSSLSIGADVQAWIEADPDRLWNNEDWAMCGGTALWGVCRSVFTADPVAGQLWLPQYLPYLDTYAVGVPGGWNNSWNVWYAHAYHASSAILTEPQWVGRAFALVDTLLDEDTDNDGGIMANSLDPDSIDQSWVSCYLDYMGMESFYSDYLAADVMALGFLQPDTTAPIAQGEAYDVTVLVGHFSALAPFDSVAVEISGAYTASSDSTYLDAVDVDTLFLGQWTPADPGLAELTMTVSPGGVVSANDTQTLAVQVLGWGQIQGTVSDAMTADPISADLLFYLEGQPPELPYYNTSTDPGTGLYTANVIEGSYRVVVDPAPPYTDREALDVAVAPDQTVVLDFDLNPAPVVLVDDDGGEVYDTSYAVPLANAGYDVYHWAVQQVGSIGSILNEFEAAIWLTGDETDSALTISERTLLAEYLDQGGNLLLSGQNIAEYITPDPFLSDYLGAAFDSSHSPMWEVLGIEGDPLTAGMQLLFPGAGGAGNQNSTDIISPIFPGELSMHYNVADHPGAAVRRDGSYKSLFLSFGLEGVSGSGATNRQEFLTAIMDWFEVSTGLVPTPGVILPETFKVTGPVPNPFNNRARLILALPHEAPVDLTIYNLRGQTVDAVSFGTLPGGVRYIDYRFNSGMASGVYIFALEMGDRIDAVKGIFLK
jgi:hypothetical protein